MRPGPSGVLSGRPIIGGVLGMAILLGALLYGVSRVVSDTENVSASEPYTVGPGRSADIPQR